MVVAIIVVQYFLTLFVCIKYSQVSSIHINPVVYVGGGSGVFCLEESTYMYDRLNNPK